MPSLVLTARGSLGVTNDLVLLAAIWEGRREQKLWRVDTKEDVASGSEQNDRVDPFCGLSKTFPQRKAVCCYLMQFERPVQ